MVDCFPRFLRYSTSGTQEDEVHPLGQIAFLSLEGMAIMYPGLLQSLAASL